MKNFIALMILFNIPPAMGRAIELKIKDYGWATSSQPIKDILDFYVQGVENTLNDEQPIIDPSRFNYGTANSSVIASKGLGTDYVNDPVKYQVSLGLGVGWDDERNAAIKDEVSGAAAASSLTVGARVAKKMMGFINFGSFTHSRMIAASDIDIAGDIEATNFGLHLRYDLVENSGSEWWGWGGVKLHTGYEFNSNIVDLESTLDESLVVDSGGSGVLEGRLTGRPTYRVKTQTHSLPLEISSSVLFLKAFSLYGGLGADLNYGQSKGKGDVKGDITTLGCTSGVCVGETVLPQLETQANYNAVSQVRNVTFRGFAGLQLNLPLKLHAFGQVEQMFGTKVIGAQAGMKYSF